MDDRIRGNLEGVRARIAEAARRSGRGPDAVRLVAVTKTNPPDRIVPLVEAGQLDLGENFPQELWRKVEALSARPEGIRWHLIGHLQSNKAKRTAPMVRLVHGVDSLKLLRLLDELAADLPGPPGICLQANCSGEGSKHGWSPGAMLDDAEAIASCRSIPIVGLMTMAGYGTTDEEARPTFAALRELRDRMRDRTGLELPELSMGMSGDFGAAIEEGATLVRVGSALFEGLDPP
ncbi:YggS family pyridoxal phosphate-dependent enzyme [Tautonia plasticadhaerens]|uniref:Pyridoxal phosphate homeostasis protein n=1 Tax=Tautonia plasticadhaerens TaxID=2527974 RepID=A0A518H4M0_9BACT|nr:YggS family pyridoxal phosphate-dependent enzyme [Tautonia plasticadhaerens]QDV35786.1 Pyridoxal phosphate homeostasis protein [Tautonia plasticadhaerens]